MNKAVFFDLDGTLMEDQSFKLIEGYRNLRFLNTDDFLVIIVTNQPGIAKGQIDWNDYYRRINFLKKEFDFHIYDYVCPHFENSDGITYPGDIKLYKTKCLCRKPQTGLFTKACFELDIDKSKSWMVGNSDVDIQAGNDFGLKTILINDEKDPIYTGINPTYLEPSLEWSINRILRLY